MQSDDQPRWPDSAQPDVPADGAAWPPRPGRLDAGRRGTTGALEDDTREFPAQPEADQDGADGADETSAPTARATRSLLVELPVLIVVALVIALVIKTFVVQAFFIPTGSMQDTLEIGDKILVNKLVYHFRSIEPGDIIVFNGAGTWDPSATSAGSSSRLARLYDDTLHPLFSSVAGLFGTPLDQVDYVKRVIGVPGDHVRCCNAQGLVIVNGVPLHEQSYLYPGNRPASTPAGIPSRFNFTVPPGYLWVLGDHRSVSDDSRGHEADPGNGMVLQSKVVGRAFVIVWPPSRWRVLQLPATFAQVGIDRPATAAKSAAARSAAARSAAARSAAADPAEATQLLSVRLRPEPAYLPLTGGIALAMPLTWLQRRTRRRLRRRWNRS